MKQIINFAFWAILLGVMTYYKVPQMTQAAVVFYIISIMLGQSRLEQLGKPYPTLKSIGLMTALMAVFVIF